MAKPHMSFMKIIETLLSWPQPLHRRAMMMRRSLNVLFLVCGVLFLLIVFSVQAEELVDSRKQLTLFSLTKKGPVVDGNLDDSCWNDAHVQRARGFVRLMD